MAAYYECDSCGEQMHGYDRKELEGEGWVWHVIDESKPYSSPKFVCCGDCEHKFERRRREAAELARVAA